MKKIIMHVVLVLLVTLTPTFVYCANNAGENETSQAILSWRKLNAGMTASQVRSILGEPSRIEVYPYINHKDWEYENGGKVTFDNENNKGSVISWSEPYEFTSSVNKANDPTDPGFMEAYGGIVLLALWFIAIYFLPSIIAGSKKKRNAGAIFALNLLLGWTLIGWVIAFVWSLTHDK